eukprot:1525500-Rhodomonas_salina.1
MEHMQGIFDPVKREDDVFGIDLSTFAEVYSVYMRQRDPKTLRIDLSKVKLSDELARKIVS